MSLCSLYSNPRLSQVKENNEPVLKNLRASRRGQNKDGVIIRHNGERGLKTRSIGKIVCGLIGRPLASCLFWPVQTGSAAVATAGRERSIKAAADPAVDSADHRLRSAYFKRLFPGPLSPVPGPTPGRPFPPIWPRWPPIGPAPGRRERSRSICPRARAGRRVRNPGRANPIQSRGQSRTSGQNRRPGPGRSQGRLRLRLDNRCTDPRPTRSSVRLPKDLFCRSLAYSPPVACLSVYRSTRPGRDQTRPPGPPRPRPRRLRPPPRPGPTSRKQPPSMRNAQPLVNARATVVRASARTREKVGRETPIISAAV